MQRRFWIVAFLALGTAVCFAQTPKLPSSCQVKPGQTGIAVKLSGTSMEPDCEPARIRIADHTSVLITIEDISPIEVCGIIPKAQTITTVVNPLESIFNTITAYKNFDIGPATAHTALYKVKGKEADYAAFELFKSLSGQVIPKTNAVIDKQNTAQKQYGADIKALSDYAVGVYRGTSWDSFKPDQAASLAQAKNDSTFPKVLADGTTKVPSELDWAPIQALIDQMKTLQTRLTASCTSAGTTCDADELAVTANDVENAISSLAILNDNFKSLQTQQAAVYTAFTTLKKIRTDFDARVNTGIVNKFPADAVAGQPPVPTNTQILYMSIPLGRDYGTTDTGTISCTTTSTPAVATTDAINYTILYQNVPALTVSTGILLTFLPKYEYGVVSTLDANSVNLGATPPDPGTFTNYFAQTDYARASVFPMAFVNYRLFKPYLKSWWAEPNSELAITNNISGGIGVNPNTGTNQVEFFGGYAIGFSRALVHFGEHWGRQESLGGGFTVNSPVPTGWSSSNTVPINWKYQHYFAMGFSVRIAPF